MWKKIALKCLKVCIFLDCAQALLAIGLKQGTVSFDGFFGFQSSESKFIKRNEFRFKLCNLSKKFLQRKSIDAFSERKNECRHWD